MTDSCERATDLFRVQRWSSASVNDEISGNLIRAGFKGEYCLLKVVRTIKIKKWIHKDDGQVGVFSASDRYG